MTTLHSLISVVVMLAVAGSPLATLAQSCCCAKPVNERRACCPTKQAADETSRRGCCAKQPAPQLVHLRSDCCCLLAPPAAPPAEVKTAKSLTKHGDTEVVYLPVDRDVAAPPARELLNSLEGHALCGPPLLAHYCRWLK